MNYRRVILAGETVIGGYDEAFKIFAIVSIAAYISSVMCAIIEGTLSTKNCFQMLFQKISVFMLIGVCNLIDMWIINGNELFRKMAILYYISHEGINVLENMVYLGVPVPRKIRILLEILQ